jgi:alpha 1,3-glucosidase
LVHFLSEGGFLDCLIVVRSPLEAIEALCEVTGFPPLPPQWALGYHQCRWGYKPQSECEEVIRRLDEAGIPFDCFWLDLQHLQDRSPWNYDSKAFPRPEELEAILEREGRELVRLCDCHLPASSSMAESIEVRQRKLYVKNPDGSPYIGFCWPGRTIWVDFFDPLAREWWSARTSAERGYFWNDMNEPSAFGIWNRSISKDCRLGHFTDREVHNAYATLQSAATFEGMIRRDSKRPFSLTRSFFAGSQRYAWAWTGDNGSSLLHMQKSVSMVANAGLCAMPFIGADVGGFSSSCDPIVLTRWYQIAAWTYPFFREHCIFTAARREPSLFDAHLCALMRQAVVERYEMIPFWYTAAWRAHRMGAPLVRPTFIDFPDSDFEHDRDGEVIVDGAVFCSVSPEVVGERQVTLPPGGWFDRDKHYLSGDITISGGLEVTPVFFRAGRIIPVMSVVGKSTAQSIDKPLTLLIFEDEHGQAVGDLYIDDYRSRAYENGTWVHRRFQWQARKLSCREGERSGAPTPEIPRRVCDKVDVRAAVHSFSRTVELLLNDEWEMDFTDA